MDRNSIAQFQTATDFIAHQHPDDLALRERPQKPCASHCARAVDELTTRRRMLGWSVKDVAERSEIAEISLAEFEQGAPPRLDQAERWAAALGLRIALVPADSELRRGLKVDWPLRRVTVDGTPVRLTPMEWKALERLARTPGEVVTHQALFHHLYGDERHYRVQSTAIRVLITKLRRLLPLRIEAQWGKGYVVTGLEASLPPTLGGGAAEPPAPARTPFPATNLRFDRPSPAKTAPRPTLPQGLQRQVIAIAEPRIAAGTAAPAARAPCRAEELGVIERFLAERGATRCPDVATIQQSPLPTLVWDKVKRKWVRPAAPGRVVG